jgi:hypothetical protein
MVCIRVVGEESRAANCSGSVLGCVDRRPDSVLFGVLSVTDGDASRTTELCGAVGDITVPDEDGCLDFVTKSRRAASRSVSDRPVTLLLSGVLGVVARGAARLLGFSPPMRLPILPVSIGAGAVGALDLDSPRPANESDRGEPMDCPMLSRLGRLDWTLKSPDGALNEGDERPVEIDPPVFAESLGRYIVGGSLNLGAEGAAEDDLPLENGLERIDGVEFLTLGEDTEPLKLRDGAERVIDGDRGALGAGLERIMDDDRPGLNDGPEADGLLGLIDGLDPRNDGLWLGDVDWRPADIRSDRELLPPAAGAATTCIRGPDSSVMMTTAAIPAALRSFLAPAVIIVISFRSLAILHSANPLPHAAATRIADIQQGTAI